MLIVFKVELTDEQKLAVRNAVTDLDDDEFVILLQTALVVSKKV